MDNNKLAKCRAFAESLGLKFEASNYSEDPEFDEYSVEGPTEKVIAFRDKLPAYGTGWYDMKGGQSAYFFSL